MMPPPMTMTLADSGREAEDVDVDKNEGDLVEERQCAAAGSRLRRKPPIGRRGGRRIMIMTSNARGREARVLTPCVWVGSM